MKKECLKKLTEVSVALNALSDHRDVIKESYGAEEFKKLVKESCKKLQEAINEI